MSALFTLSTGSTLSTENRELKTENYELKTENREPLKQHLSDQ